MQFIDRKAKYPGRWTMKKSDGTSEVVTLVRNDEPIVEGTPMNAATLNELSGFAITIDKTLSVEGNAADAKASGDAIRGVMDDLALEISRAKQAEQELDTRTAALESCGFVVVDGKVCMKYRKS